MTTNKDRWKFDPYNAEVGELLSYPKTLTVDGSFGWSVSGVDCTLYFGNYSLKGVYDETSKTATFPWPPDNVKEVK